LLPYLPGAAIPMNASQLPNLITALRIAAVPVLILLLREHDYRLALAVFVLAGLSDGLDGLIAKRFHYVSRLGSILDPIADKLLLVSTYVMLALLDHLPFWLVLAVVSRDALIVGGYLIYTSLYGPVQMRPSRFSKLNTLAQIALALTVLTQLALAAPPTLLTQALVYVTAATTIGSGVHYLWTWIIRKQVQSAAREDTHD
jgi:cardiolipin synthase